MDFITITLKNNDGANLLFTDTDSLVYEIETKYVYEDFYGYKNLFDFSVLPRDSKFLILLINMLLVRWKMNSKER